MGEPKFGEKWAPLFPHDPQHGTAVYDSTGVRIAQFNLPHRKLRAIACVNACAGIDHPEALPALLEYLKAGEHLLPETIRARYRALFSKDDPRG